jgi:hypothetical protein
VARVGGTIAANGAYGWPYGPVGEVLSTWPGAAFAIAVELARSEVPGIRRIRKEMHLGQPRAHQVRST